MIDKPKKDDDAPELETSWEDFDDTGEEESQPERPTLAPPFDVDQYAKDTASETRPVAPKMAGGVRGKPPPLGFPTPAFGESRVAMRPGPEDERASDSAITMPPPPMEDAAPRGRPTPTPASGHNILSLANRNAPSSPPNTNAIPTPVPAAGAIDALAARAAGDVGEGGAGDPLTEMRERFALGDYSGALVMAESMLEENPSHVEAREYAESCRSVLQQMYTARIGPLDRVPIVEVARDQMRWLSIDHRAGFVLSLVDGVSSLEMILDVSGMPALDALRILYELVQQRIISFR